MPASQGAPTVLVVDDEPAIVDSLQKIFEREGLRVLTAGSGGEALDILRRERDLGAAHRPDDAGDDGHGPAQAPARRRARDRGRADDRLRHRRDRGRGDEGGRLRLRHQAAQARARRAHRQQRAREAVARVREPRAARAAGRREAPALDRAVAGVAAHDGHRHAGGAVDGDRAAARRVGHRQGAARARASTSTRPRANGPFVPVNCAALPETILEAELFGYEKGAFTGAVHAPRRAASSQADGGTLFLDEIGEIPPTSRSSCCACCRRARSSGSAGGRMKVDVRLVAATNQDLRARGARGPLPRGPLLPAQRHRRAVPPLRERRDDIPLLAEHFLQLYAARRTGKLVRAFARAPLDALSRYDWPGNVRELENAIERAVVLSRGSAARATTTCRARCARRRQCRRGRRASLSFADRHAARGDRAAGDPRDPAPHGGDKRLAAQLLGIATRTIYRRLEEERDRAPIRPTSRSERPPARPERSLGPRRAGDANLAGRPRRCHWMLTNLYSWVFVRAGLVPALLCGTPGPWRHCYANTSGPSTAWSSPCARSSSRARRRPRSSES